MSDPKSSVQELVTFYRLTDEERLAEIKKDHDLCVYVNLFEKEMSKDCISYCEQVWKFKAL